MMLQPYVRQADEITRLFRRALESNDFDIPRAGRELGSLITSIGIPT